MNANQIINMIIKIVMRKAISKGVDAGFNRATRGRGGRQKPLPPEPSGQGDGMTKAEIREMRRARRARREARQAAKDAQ